MFGTLVAELILFKVLRRLPPGVEGVAGIPALPATEATLGRTECVPICGLLTELVAGLCVWEDMGTGFEIGWLVCAYIRYGLGYLDLC